MVAQISDIVDVSISVAALSPSRAQFSVPLIASYHTDFPEVVKTYASLTELADDFDSSSPVYAAAQAMLSQSPTVRSFKVGRLGGTQQARVITMIPTVRNSTAYVVTIDGTDFTFTSDADATLAEIIAGLVAAINAGSLPVTAADVTSTSMTLTADVAGPDFLVDVGDISLWASIQDTSTTRGSAFTTALDDIEASDPDWYGLVLTRSNAAEINLAAAWVEARTKILFANAINFGSAVTAEDNLADNATNLLADLNTSGYDRTIALFSKHDADLSAAALAGAILCRDPGSYTVKFKSLSGVQADNLTSTQKALIEDRKGNHYQTVAGIPIVQEGWASSGQFLDIQIFVDWLDATLKEEIFAALSFNEKVPFTNAGIAMLEGVVRKVLQRGVAVGGLASFETSVADVGDLSSVDKAARYLNSINFSGVLAGAIHKVRIVGKVTA